MLERPQAVTLRSFLRHRSDDDFASKTETNATEGGNYYNAYTRTEA